MKLFKFCLIALLGIFIILLLTNPSLKKHQETFRNALNTALKITNDNSTFLYANKISENQIDSLVKRDSYFIFSRTQIIVNEQLVNIGIGICGTIMLNTNADSVLKNITVKIIEKPKVYNIAELCTDERRDSTVLIGNQIWMKKDFDGTFYNNGDSIPEVTNDSVWNNLKTGAWCYLDNDAKNLKKLGRLYNWYALNDPRGIVPEGFRIPEADDWEILMKSQDYSSDKLIKTVEKGKRLSKLINLNNAFILNNTVGYKLKKAIGWSGLGNGSNQSGFGAVQAGDRHPHGAFTYDNAHWWCKSGLPSGVATIFFVALDSKKVYLTQLKKEFAFSIRFLKK